MKKIALFLFLVLGLVVFIMQLQAIRNNKLVQKKKEASVQQSTTSKAVSFSPKTVATTKPQPVELPKKTTYDKFERNFQSWFVPDDVIKEKIMHNPYLPSLFKNNQGVYTAGNSPWFGYYGPNFAMLECYIDSAEFDEHNNKIMLSGLTRLGKQICEVTGYVTIDKIGINTASPGAPNLNTRYGALGTFHLDEVKQGKRTGTYEAHWCADISEIANEAHQLEINGTELLINGTWQSAVTGNIKQFCLTGDFVQIGDDVFHVFTVGERDWSLNEPYASNGWRDYYEGENWWIRNK